MQWFRQGEMEGAALPHGSVDPDATLMVGYNLFGDGKSHKPESGRSHLACGSRRNRTNISIMMLGAKLPKCRCL